MSILSTKPKSPPSAADIERQLEPARARVIELETAIGQAALDAVTGDPEALQRHARVKADLLAAHDKLDLLNRAHQGAIDREKADLAARQAAIRKTQIESRKRDAAALRKLAEEFAAAEANANRLYQEMLTVAEKIVVPVAGVALPDGSINPGRIRQLVIGERYRISAPHVGMTLAEDHDARRLLPGAGSPDLHLTDNPQAIPAFVDQVKTECEALIRYYKEAE